MSEPDLANLTMATITINNFKTNGGTCSIIRCHIRIPYTYLAPAPPMRRRQNVECKKGNYHLLASICRAPPCPAHLSPPMVLCETNVTTSIHNDAVAKYNFSYASNKIVL